MNFPIISDNEYGNSIFDEFPILKFIVYTKTSRLITFLYKKFVFDKSLYETIDENFLYKFMTSLLINNFSMYTNRTYTN